MCGKPVPPDCSQGRPCAQPTDIVLNKTDLSTFTTSSGTHGTTRTDGKFSDNQSFEKYQFCTLRQSQQAQLIWPTLLNKLSTAQVNKLPFCNKTYV